MVKTDDGMDIDFHMNFYRNTHVPRTRTQKTNLTLVQLGAKLENSFFGAKLNRIFLQ